jgi:hypothetical protein
VVAQVAEYQEDGGIEGGLHSHELHCAVVLATAKSLKPND